MKIRKEFFIGVQDIGKDNKITNKAILDILCNIANMHSNTAGQGLQNMKESNVSWYILNWKVEIYQRPTVCQYVTAETWSQNYSKIQAIRDFIIYNSDNEIIAKATSKWLAINTQNNRILRLTDEFMSCYKTDRNYINFPDYSFEDIENIPDNIICNKEFKPTKSMIDYNGHIHNTEYINIAREILPDNICYENLNNIEILYKKEIKPENTVLCGYILQDNKYYVVIKDNENKNIHSIIVLY